MSNIISTFKTLVKRRDKIPRKLKHLHETHTHKGNCLFHTDNKYKSYFYATQFFYVKCNLN